jgi:hypothetical protein
MSSEIRGKVRPPAAPHALPMKPEGGKGDENPGDDEKPRSSVFDWGSMHHFCGPLKVTI